MSEFKIAAAQVPSIRGDLDGNIEMHRDVIMSAVRHGVSVLVFPELSLMGYEPEIAHEFELDPADNRIISLARLAQQCRMQVVAGAAIQNGLQKPHLGAFILSEDGSVSSYAKMHLGGCEPTYFTPGNALKSISSQRESIGLSICADSSKRSHPAAYASTGTTIYAASVFLNADLYATDSPRFAAYALDFGMLCLMANHGASVGTLVSVGNSAVWAPDGSLLASAAGTQSALVVATRTGQNWVGEVVVL